MSWTAALLGIDINRLYREHPSDPEQVFIRRQHERKAQEYWAFHRQELPPVDDWYTVAEVAEKLYYTKATVYRLVRAGYVESKKDRGRLFVRAKDVEVYVAARHARETKGTKIITTV
jgi:excisionase family DNA binding protein